LGKLWGSTPPKVVAGNEADLEFTPDEIGEWSERKISIVSRYAQAYSNILAAKGFKHHYIDGFTGGGLAVRKVSKEPVETTASRILAIEPPFVGYHLVDFDPAKAAAMKAVCARRPQAEAICGDANEILPDIFKKIRWDKYERALCFLDPYSVMLSWHVVKAAGATNAIEAFINLPTGDIQRNVLRRDIASVDSAAVERMNKMWGDDSWRQAAYVENPGLFWTDHDKQSFNKVIAAFTRRLKSEAGFKYVSHALPMRNH
jgi:three-Cys-motif partner protein